MKICFVIPGESGQLFARAGFFPDIRTTAAFSQACGHEVTILFADADGEASLQAMQSWREPGCSVHSLAAEKFCKGEPFFPGLLRNSWLTYQWLKPRGFDRILFRDDSSAGLISLAAKRLGEAFDTTRLIYQLNGPAGWSVHLRDRRQLIHDDVTLPYSVQYGVENADQLIVPAGYFLDRIEKAGWVPTARVSVLPRLAQQTDATREPTPAALRLIYPVHDSDRAPLTVFLRAVSALARQGADVRIFFLCHGDAREQRTAAKRLGQAIATNAAGVSYEILDGADGLPFGSRKVLWLFCPLWLNLPFLLLEAASRGEALLLAASAEAHRIVDEPDCLVEWAPAALQAKLTQCLNGDLPHPVAVPRGLVEKAWQVELFDSGSEASPLSIANPANLRVSVCVAHFNKPRDLREALASLQTQTHSNLEVIVVDDASTDPEARKAFETAATSFDLPGWKFIRESENHGPGQARNRAVKESTGSHLVFFDADDVAFPDMVERLLGGLIRSRGACVAGSSRRLREDHGERLIEGTSTYVGGSLENAFLYPPAGTVFIVAKETFESVGGFKPDLPNDCHEDWNFHLRLLAQGHRIHVLPEPVFAYRHVQLSRSLLVPQDMALVLEPLLNCTPQVRRNLLNLTIERAGAMESAVRLLGEYERFAGGIRFLRMVHRFRRSLLRLFRRQRKS